MKQKNTNLSKGMVTMRFEGEHGVIEFTEAGSIDGNGIIIGVYDEQDNELADPFLNKDQTVKLRDYLNEVINSGWLNE